MISTARRLAAGCTALMLVAQGPMGCATPSKRDTTASSDPTAAEPGAATDLPPEVADALIPDVVPAEREESRNVEPRFDVTVDRAPARQFFMSLVEGTDQSIALAPGVDGEITLSLRDVSVEEVLDVVQQAYGYGYERTRTGFLVLPAGFRTRVFQLDYLNLHRMGTSDTRVSSGQISDQVAGNNGNNGNGSSGDGTSSGPYVLGGQKQGSNTGSRVQTQSDADLWKEIVTSVEAIVDVKDGREVVSSPQAGLLVVRAYPDELDRVAAYLRSAELSLNRVVILEAKILEVTLKDGFQSGINWAKLANVEGGTGVVGQTGGGTVQDTGYSNSRNPDGPDLGPALSDLFAGTASSAFGGVFSLALQADKFSVFIELLQSQGKVRTLSNPRISTVNNQKAVIKVGSDEFFVTNVSTTVVTGTATTSTPNVTLTPFFSGIALDVTPQISDIGDVILHVHPAVTEVQDQTKTFTISNQKQELPLAFSTIRESDSIVRAKSGQIVVIGGLIQNDSRDQTYGVPWLSRIPWVGRLFEHSKLSSQRTELVILLRPIVVEKDVWASELREASDRIDTVWDKGRKSRDSELRMDGWLPPTPPVADAPGEN